MQELEKNEILGKKYKKFLLIFKKLFREESTLQKKAQEASLDHGREHT